MVVIFIPGKTSIIYPSGPLSVQRRSPFWNPVARHRDEEKIFREILR